MNKVKQLILPTALAISISMTGCADTETNIQNKVDETLSNPKQTESAQPQSRETNTTYPDSSADKEVTEVLDKTVSQVTTEQVVEIKKKDVTEILNDNGVINNEEAQLLNEVETKVLIDEVFDGIDIKGINQFKVLGINDKNYLILFADNTFVDSEIGKQLGFSEKNIGMYMQDYIEFGTYFTDFTSNTIIIITGHDLSKNEYYDNIRHELAHAIFSEKYPYSPQKALKEQKDFDLFIYSELISYTFQYKENFDNKKDFLNFLKNDDSYLANLLVSKEIRNHTIQKLSKMFDEVYYYNKEKNRYFLREEIVGFEEISNDLQTLDSLDLSKALKGINFKK